MIDEDEAYPTGNIRLYPCDICGRRFKQDALSKHRQACKKLTTSKRKVFDSGRQRAAGSDVNYVKTKETKKIQIEGEKPREAPPRNNWREKHEQFLRNVRQARGLSEAIKTGAPLPKFEYSAVPSDYVNCQYCGRNFSRTAAERHIPFCETQSKRQKFQSSANQKQAAINQRSKFQAPASGQRKQSSDPYESNSRSMMNYGGGGGGGAAASNHHAGGYGKGYSNVSSGSDRKPLKYDSNMYYESDSQQDMGAYSMKNKAAIAQRNARQNEILRTGRNTINSELNAQARNRSGNNISQKESPLTRDPSGSRRIAANGNGRQPVPMYSKAQADPRAGGGAAGGGPTFCSGCGSQFPVKWAKFCSFCGGQRI